MNSQLKFGIISDAKAGFARVLFEEDDIVSDWWPVLMRTSLIDKESWLLNVNEHVVCLCDERCELGVILGSIANEKDPVEAGAGEGKFRRVFSDGTVIEYDKESHKLTADVKGAVEVSCETQLTAKALVKASVEAPQIELKGSVTVLGVLTAAGLSVTTMPGVPGSDGKITAAADIETTGDIKAGTVSLKSHVHSGVISGPGTSGPPVGA